jgi:hypothetical protein
VIQNGKRGKLEIVVIGKHGGRVSYSRGFIFN